MSTITTRPLRRATVPPQGDRAAIYAAMGVAELWRFDGQTLTIGRLDDHGRYQPVEQSGFLHVRADQVPRWLLDEDLYDYGAWTRRVREWAAKELRGSSGGPGDAAI